MKLDRKRVAALCLTAPLRTLELSGTGFPRLLARRPDNLEGCRWAQPDDVSGLASLAGLALLGLGSNQLSDISPLSGLEGLTLLDLGGNRIVDISPLAGLTNLTGLGLAGNAIAEAGVLSGLRLTVLAGLKGSLALASHSSR